MSISGVVDCSLQIEAFCQTQAPAALLTYAAHFNFWFFSKLVGVN